MAKAMPMDASQGSDKQPPALRILFFTEMWERFSFYGLRALLILFITSELLFDDKKAYGIYGTYGALVYAAPVIGGYIADRLLGYMRTIYIGGFIIAIGNFILATSHEMSLYAGLACIIVGTGFFKSNITSLLGQYYKANDPRRDGAFTIFYMGINIGAFFSPLLCGTIGEKYGWHYGFGLAGLGMLFGVFTLWKGRHELAGAGDPPNPLKVNKVQLKVLGGVAVILPLIALMMANFQYMEYFLPTFGVLTLFYVLYLLIDCNPEERKCMLTFLLMLPFYLAFFASFEQAGGSLNLFAERNVDRVIFGWEVPATWFQSLNPLYIVVFAPFFSRIWTHLGRTGKDLMTPLKFVLGLLGVSLGFYVLAIGCGLSTSNGVTSVLWISLAYLAHTLAELCISPIGLSMATKLSPKRFVGLMVGVLFLSISFANYLASLIAVFFSNNKANLATDKVASLSTFQDIFDFLIYFPLVAALILLVISPFLRGIFSRHQ